MPGPGVMARTSAAMKKARDGSMDQCDSRGLTLRITCGAKRRQVHPVVGRQRTWFSNHARGPGGYPIPARVETCVVLQLLRLPAAYTGLPSTLPPGLLAPRLTYLR